MCYQILWESLSWNVRGLGGSEKRKEVKELVREKYHFVLCLQETKMQSIDDFLCTSLWGPLNCDYSFSPSVGASGGLLTVWDTSEVEVWASSRGDHFLSIHGRFIKSNAEFYLFNVYAPCDQRAKQTLWTSLSARLQSLGSCIVYLCRDFNSIRNPEERRSVRGSQVVDDFATFNNFINDCV
jgi:exonuclease III